MSSSPADDGHDTFTVLMINPKTALRSAGQFLSNLPHTMSFTSGGRSGAPVGTVNPGPQRRAVTAFVNLFEISLDRMGRMVYQYDGSSSFHLFSFTEISSSLQLVSRSRTR